MSQCALILSYLERNGTITQKEALRECGCMRLASRIHDLRKAGFHIVSETVAVPARDEKLAYVARYRLGV